MDQNLTTQDKSKPMEDKDILEKYTIGNLDPITLDPNQLTSTCQPYLNLGGTSSTWIADNSGIFTSGLNWDYNPHDDLVLSEESDIKIGSMSLKETLAEISKHLGMLIPDKKLEKEYQELKEAREHYEHVKKKLETLEKLKNTPIEPLVK